MSLPTATTLATLNYVFRGQPFVEVPAKAGIDLSTMDYVYHAQPFVRNPYPAAEGGYANIFIGVAGSNIGYAIGVAGENIAKINGV